MKAPTPWPLPRAVEGSGLCCGAIGVCFVEKNDKGRHLEREKL